MTKVFKNNSENIILEIQDDGLSASLTIKDQKDTIDENEITSLLKNAGVKKGFLNAKEYNFKQKIKKDFNKPFLIALDVKPKAELDLYYFIRKEPTIHPHSLQKVSELNKLVRIKCGDQIAKVKVKVIKKRGIDIYGNETTAALSKETSVQKILGTGVIYSTETEKIISKTDGFLFIDKEGKINVFDKAVIHGNISDQSIKTAGNLVFKGNITESRLEVDGNLTLNSIEKSEVICSGNLEVEKGIRYCEIFVDGEVIGDKDSFIKGGLIQSGKNIVLGSAGSPFSVPTNIELSFSPYIKHVLRETDSENIEDRKKLEKEYEQNMDKITENNIRELSIKFLKKIFSEVSIRIFNKSHFIHEDIDSPVFYNNGDRIENK